MHIAIVAPEFPPEIGGIQTYAAEFAKELVGRGHRVTVFTRRRAEAQSNLPDMDIRGVLTGRAVADLPHFRGIQADAWHVMNAAYAWLALHFKPTVVSIHGNDFLRPYIPAGEPELSAVPGLWRAPGLRLAIEQHVGAWRTPRLVRAGLGRASRILANSRYTEQVFLAQFPECAGRTQAAMVGVGADFLREGEKKSVHPIPQLITVCRLSERRKNVDLVLRALALLKDRYEFRYLVVGDGEIRAELEALADELGLAGRVEFAGFLSAEVLRDRLAQSDLFVLVASINQHSHEGFGIAYLEANACGTPALAANLAGAAEAVQAGASGFFADGLGVESVAAALQRFLSGELRFDPAACRAFARRFTWQQVVDQAMPWYGQPQQLVRRVALASHGGEGLT